jgi:hypothetical protein
MDDDDKSPPKGILSFVLGDGSPWAGPMKVLGLDDDEPKQDELLSSANVWIPPDSEWLH